MTVAGAQDMLCAVEETFLGVATAPLRRRMEEAGWLPDGPTSYCSQCGRSLHAPGAECRRCPEKPPPWSSLVRLGAFEGLARDIVHEIKFTGWRRLGRDAGRLLGHSLRERLGAEGAPQAVIVPIPMSTRRRLARGIDHTDVIACGASLTSGIEVARWLSRRHGPTQRSVPASKRAGNVRGRFRARRGARLGDQEGVIVLLDDVMTTGATLAAACRALRTAGWRGRLWAAVLCVAEGD